MSLSSFDDKRFILENGISTLPHGQESDPSDCVVVAQLTEDEANATDYLDFDNLFSRAKRRRMEIVSDSE